MNILLLLFGPKRDEVTGGWRKLHDEELRDLYFPINRLVCSDIKGGT
jgi:hypothetical protein